MKNKWNAKATLNTDQLVEQAQRETGLEDFGWDAGDSVYDGFMRLLEPGKETYPFSDKGVAYFNKALVAALKNRLYLAYLLKRHPQILARSINAPMVVTGMPRSGTTLLQNLLACDENRRCLGTWEAYSLSPELSKQEKIKQQEDFFRDTYALMDQQKKMHYVSAQDPEECNVLLRSTFVIPFVYQMFNRNMDFTLWHFSVDQKRTYSYFKKQLQVAQFLHGDSNRWSLKSPVHIFYADALYANFPDARLIVTHRDPRNVLPSSISLALSNLAVLTKIQTSQYAEYAAMSLMQSEFASAHSIAQVQALPAQAVINVQYNDLMENPIAKVEEIYGYFNEPFSTVFVKAMEEYLRQNPQHKHGKHEYSLQQYAISEQQLMEKFAAYIEIFKVKLGL